VAKLKSTSTKLKIILPEKQSNQMNWKLVIHLFLSLSLSSSLLTGCGATPKDEKEETVISAYRLIDEQRTDEAVALLESALEKDPKNYEYKSVLASAYAHKSGIKIQKLVAAINASDKLKSFNDPLAGAKPDQTNDNRVDTSANSTITLLSRFSDVLKTYSTIPVVDATQAIYLKQGIYILNDLGSEIKPEDALYRAVLEIVLFKHILANQLIGEFIEPATKDKKSCIVDFSTLNSAIVDLGKLLIDIYNDAGIINPKQAATSKELAEQVKDAILNISTVTTAVTVADETVNVLLKQAAIQNGFGKIIKCSGDSSAL
jgi:hypothetical protein